MTSSTKPQKSQANRGLPTTKHTELRITGKDPDTAGSRSDSATSSSAGATPKVNDNKSTPDSPASNSNTAQGQTELVNDMQLAVPQLVCQQGQPVWSVASGELKMQTALAVDGSVMWAWEVRVDSGGGNSNASPIDTSVHSQAASAGQTDITLTTNSNQSGPLVTAPESVDYGYSFRLHVTAPVDAASDWVSVPQASGSGC